MSVIDPINRNRFFPAIITNVHNDYFFSIRTIINLFNEEEISNESVLFCHNGTYDIFPIDWCAKNRLKLFVPKGSFFIIIR